MDNHVASGPEEEAVDAVRVPGPPLISNAAGNCVPGTVCTDVSR